MKNNYKFLLTKCLSILIQDKIDLMYNSIGCCPERDLTLEELLVSSHIDIPTFLRDYGQWSGSDPDRHKNLDNIKLIGLVDFLRWMLSHHYDALRFPYPYDKNPFTENDDEL